jgi:hypothetical protein
MIKLEIGEYIYFHMYGHVPYFAKVTDIQETMFPRGAMIYFDKIKDAKHLKGYKFNQEKWGQGVEYFDDGVKQMEKHKDKGDKFVYI